MMMSAFKQHARMLRTRDFRAAHTLSLLVAAFLLIAATTAVSVRAQTPSAFTYQGRLTDAGAPATGTYDLQFALFDTIAGGAQAGATTMREDVAVVNGIFTVTLDFDAPVFISTAAKFLEIGVRPGASEGDFTLLAPRQPVTSSPYAVQTINAERLGGFPASEYVRKTAGGTDFVQNSTVQQANANFNIAGNGIVGGTLGVGMNPGGFKFSVNGSAQIRPRGSDESSISFFSDPTGNVPTISLTKSDSSKAEMRLEGSSLRLANGFGFGTPQDGLTIARFGNVGVGTTTPQAKFHASGGSSWFQGDSTPLPAAAGKGIVVGFAGEQGYIQSFDYGTFTPKNLLLNNSGGNVGINTSSPTQARLQVEGGTQNGIVAATQSANRYALFANGNAGQVRDKGGMVKAMLYITYTSNSATIARCYDGVVLASSNGCSSIVFRNGGFNSSIRVAFPYTIGDRFLSLTALNGETLFNIQSVTVDIGTPTFSSGSFFIYVY
jgi:hypothetical protein